MTQNKNWRFLSFSRICRLWTKKSSFLGPEKLENMSAMSTKIQSFNSVNNSQEVFGQKWIIYCCHNSLREFFRSEIWRGRVLLAVITSFHAQAPFSLFSIYRYSIHFGIAAEAIRARLLLLLFAMGQWIKEKLHFSALASFHWQRIIHRP